MKIYLDDTRPIPDNTWTQCYSVNEFITLLQYIKMEDVEVISLDYDLGKNKDNGGNGIQAVTWMAENNKWPQKIIIHDKSNKNIDGRKAMELIIKKYALKERI